MGNFKREGNFGGKKKFGGEPSYHRSGRSDGQQTMHKAVCSECGKNCEVPFRPTGEKPVFCSFCFANKDTSNKSRAERRSSNRPDHTDREMFKAICSKCHKDCEVPFRPSGGKPVFCDDCFGKGEKSNRNESHRNKDRDSHIVAPNQYKGQIEKIEKKLDLVLEILSKHISNEAVKIKEELVVESVGKKVDTSASSAQKKKAIVKKIEKKVVKKAVVKKKIVASKKTAKKVVVKKKKK